MSLIILIIATLFTTAQLSDNDMNDPRRTLNLMPLPAELETTGGVFELDSTFAVGFETEPTRRLVNGVNRFMHRMGGRTGIFFDHPHLTKETRVESPKLVISIKREGMLVLEEDESYRLTISPGRINLEAETDIGALYGLETLIQLLNTDRGGYIFPGVTVTDAPRFPWRGLMIDAARHFMPVDVIKRNLDGMLAMKLNVFHWHLTEDQGFRVESRVFPELHRQGSDGFYYTQEQIRDVIAYAADRGIRVVPEFDIPGHTTSWFVGHPELASERRRYEIERRFGIMDPTMDPTREEVYDFLDRFLGEMAALFPDNYMHIGGDEVTGVHWMENERIRRFMEEREMEGHRDLQAYFNNRVLAILQKHGKIMVGWEEILHEEMPKNIVIQSWYGRDSMIEAARGGYQSILSNGYYIDLIQPTDVHYVNNPLPPDSPLTDDEKKLILGGEATMWSEFVSPETIDSRIWPRMAAIAEVYWSEDVPTVNLPQRGRETVIPADMLTPEIRSMIADMYRRLDVISLQIEEHGLTHIRNYEVLLRRLVNGYETGRLRTLVDVIEPVKIYRRPAQRVYTSHSPLTRVVDAARPDAKVARDFRELVRVFLEEGATDVQKKAEIRRQLEMWRDNHQQLLPVIRRSPILEEIRPLSEKLSQLSELGLTALDLIGSDRFQDREWMALRMQQIENARQPHGQTEIMITTAIEKLLLKVPN
ncbi:MAG: beta-hexosaminidase [Balneolaceae bacterium]|nr:MAG: beta-hexosaminidase [Balneolaceae bacterium]